jgi:hypothetical protein
MCRQQDGGFAWWTCDGRWQIRLVGAVDVDYAPETVNTDGWPGPQNAWQTLFNQITVILCFLHAFLKIRDRAKKAFGELGQEVQRRVWDADSCPQ